MPPKVRDERLANQVFWSMKLMLVFRPIPFVRLLCRICSCTCQSLHPGGAGDVQVTVCPLGSVRTPCFQVKWAAFRTFLAAEGLKVDSALTCYARDWLTQAGYRNLIPTASDGFS